MKNDILTIGKVIKMKCMRRGLCAYPNETILVSQNALQILAPSAQGIPVVIDHPNELITEDNISQLPVVGRVGDLHYDDIDDTWYAHFIIDRQEGIDLLQEGWGISTAWFGEKYAGGGTYNNVPYDRELLEGKYEHLAIVKTPRYEMATDPIFLNSKTCKSDNNVPKIINNDSMNSNHKKASNMISKIFKKLITKEEIHTNEGEELFVDVDGKEMPISHLVDELKKNKKNEDEKKDKEEKRMANESDEVDVDGKKMSVGELVKQYKNMCKSKKNADDEEKDKEEEKEVEIEVKSASADEEKAEEKKESKKNSKDQDEQNERFTMIKELHENGVTYKLEEEFTSTREKVLLGQQRYGKK